MDHVEHVFECPYCGERVSVVVDLIAGDQRYVEDCEVCCHPIEVRARVAEAGDLEAFEARSIEQ